MDILFPVVPTLRASNLQHFIIGSLMEIRSASNFYLILVDCLIKPINKKIWQISESQGPPFLKGKITI